MGIPDPYRVIDQIVGFHVPLDTEPAYLVRCEENGRYVLSMTPNAGAITVAKKHAQRFTRETARAMADQCRARIPDLGYTLVRLRVAQRQGVDRGDK